MGFPGRIRIGCSGWKYKDWRIDFYPQGADVDAYFNNDIGGHAPRNAVTLRRLLEERG